ncbi:MAG: alpha/beta hydrolase [Candidatus Eremiobacteraeota bacterium]|nr:alpha/beta hydrolase [Candidatus Eremiobacteraeota bacterium]MBC5827585.1 alpha/beta hydrolase [Candidatus Eremiobacteraeota bacterium]
MSATQTVVLDDGAATTLETWGSGGPLIVCVHGITSSRRSWSRLTERLGRSYRVAAYDQRGHGDSARVLGPMTLAQSLADFRAVAQILGAASIAVVGHSWGGAVALLSGQDPRVAAVVAIDPMIRVEPGSWSADYLDDVVSDMALAPAERERVLRARHADWHPSDIEGKLHAVTAMTAEPVARLGSENSVEEGGWDLRPVLEGYGKPLLICAAGPADSVIADKDLAFARSHGGDRVTVRDFPREGHNLHRTAFDEFASVAEAFLQATLI